MRRGTLKVKVAEGCAAQASLIMASVLEQRVLKAATANALESSSIDRALLMHQKFYEKDPEREPQVIKGK